MTATLSTSLRRLAARTALLLTLAVCSMGAAFAQTITYFHNDVAGTPLLATNAAGAVVWKENYLPYGYRQAAEPASSGNKLWFTGKPYDPDTQLSYMGARYYMPLLGRFTGIDPVGIVPEQPHSFNRYAYANNNPYKYVDPDGRQVALAWKLGSLAVAIGTTLHIMSPEQRMQMARSASQFVSDALGRAPNLVFNEGGGGEDNAEGCIYCVSGDKTSSGKDYIGSTDNLDNRKRDTTDGRDREGATVVDTYPKGDRDERRRKEQQAINDRGGVDSLDNRRNEIAPRKWPSKGVQPP